MWKDDPVGTNHRLSNGTWTIGESSRWIKEHVIFTSKANALSIRYPSKTANGASLRLVGSNKDNALKASDGGGRKFPPEARV